MDVFHTGNYVRSHYNFLIKGLSDNANFSVVASTLHNIHFRGSPSSPSSFLRRALKDKDIELSKKASTHIDEAYSPVWTHTIKGSDQGFNPALEFFETTLPNLLREFTFLYPLFRPETLVTDIVVEEEAQKFIKERVDFFLPLANLIIEIDGSQHQEISNLHKDRSRDRLFNKYGFKTFRFSTLQLLDPKELETFGANIRKHLSSIKLVHNYKKLLGSKASESNLIYSSIYRIQAVLIEMLGRNMLSLSDEVWRLWFEVEIEIEFCQLAIEDLFNWVRLIDRRIECPEISIDRNTAQHVIEVSLSRRWDETSPDHGVVSCYTDHFDYFLDFGSQTTSSKDYFNSGYSRSSRILEPEFLDLNGLLQQIFAYDSFNSGQIDIIENVLHRSDTIGILPTGGGKSLCYQLPGLLNAGLTLVVCPIKALMRDQVQELNQIGVHRAACIDSNTSTSDKNKILNKVVEGQVRFLFVSPERLQVSDFREKIHGIKIRSLLSLVVIDEVHCMSEWGHDFRTSYLTLPLTLNNIANGVPTLCLTATASKKVLEDIQCEFNIDKDDIKTLSLYERQNLHFVVIPCKPFDRIHQILKDKMGQHQLDEKHAGIVFTPFVNGPNGAYPLYQSIRGYIPNANFFTGSKPKNHIAQNFEYEKSVTQKDFKSNKFPLLIATKAFGMGVNKTNVYTTVHAGLPQSVEALYQEAGRAGRDGKESECYVLFNPPSEDAYQKFFSYRDFKSFSELRLQNNGGDLAVHHYFLKTSVQDNYLVPAVVKKILNYLATKVSEKSEIISSELEATPSVTQLALYRLSQMGLVSDWTVADFSKGIYLIDYKIRDIDYHEKIVRGLTKSDKDPEGLGLAKEEKTLVKTMDDWMSAMNRLANIVVEHHLDTRVRSRIESLKTLLIACHDFQKQQGEEFRKNLESYFSIDSINDSLSDVVNSGGKPAAILSYLLGVSESLTNLSRQKIKSRVFPVRRFIESYPSDTSLELINEILMFHAGESQNAKTLLSSLRAYRKARGDKLDYYVFLRELALLFNKELWLNVEQQMAIYTEDRKELDSLAKALDSDHLVREFMMTFESDLKSVNRELNEFI